MNKYRLSIILIGVLMSLGNCFAQKHVDTTQDKKFSGKEAKEVKKQNMTDGKKRNPDKTKEPTEQTTAEGTFIDFLQYIEYLDALNQTLDDKLHQAQITCDSLLKQVGFRVSLDFTPESLKKYLEGNEYLKNLYGSISDIKKFAESRRDVTIAGGYVSILEAYGCVNRLCGEDEINDTKKKLDVARKEALSVHVNEINTLTTQMNNYMFAFYELGRLIRLVDEGKGKQLLEDKQQVKFIKRVPYLFSILQDYIQQEDKERKETKAKLLEKLPNLFE